MAALLEHYVMRRASGVIVANPWLGSALDRRYGCHSVDVGNPLPPDVWGRAPDGPTEWPAHPGDVRLVYTGQVYPANFDTFLPVLEALRSPRLRSVSLHVYTSSQEVARTLPMAGLEDRVVIHPFVAAGGIQAVQQRADILLLPLAFEGPFPEIIRTATPTKLSEYLVSGRPILVVAPADSYLVRVAREHDAAEVVDRPDAALVTTAIERMVSDTARREDLRRNASAAAIRYFSPEATTERFARTLVAMLTPPAGAEA
jgi:glycosyltransferase involved in cell wall biosynthesis